MNQLKLFALFIYANLKRFWPVAYLSHRKMRNITSQNTKLQYTTTINYPFSSHVTKS